MKKFLFILFIVMFFWTWLLQSNASYTRLNRIDLNWQWIASSISNFYDVEFNISQFDTILIWDYSSYSLFIDDNYWVTFCDSALYVIYDQVNNFTTFTCSANWNIRLISENLLMLINAINFRLEDVVINSTWSSLQEKMDDLIWWWRDGVNKLLSWSIWNILSFLIWFLILSLLIYKLNQVFGWFWWRK